MKVVVRGTPPEEEVWTGMCFSCKSQMEEVRSNLDVKYSLRPGEDPYADAICPICGDSFSLKKKHA